MVPTRPGQRCRVVNSRSKENGEGDGPNINKEVVTVFVHPMLAGGVTPVWHVRGKDLITYYGAVGDEADFLIHWLEVIPDELLPQKVMEKEKDLDHVE